MLTVFVDRDGVVNRRRIDDWVKSWDEFEFLPRAIEGLKLLKDAGCRLILVTNQRAIALGLMTEGGLAEIHAKMQSEMKEQSVSFDAIYFCPHDRHENCDCRKPKPGMLIQAANDFSLTLSECIMLGDSPSDETASVSAGCNKFYKVDEQKTLYKVAQEILTNEEC